MNGHLDSLYREVVLDHHKNPRGKRPVHRIDLAACGKNASCGDEVCLQLEVEAGRIKDACVQTEGCAVSTASGSMLAELVKGESIAEARRIAGIFKRVMHGEEPPDEVDLGDLEALTGIRKFPVRVKCALLPWVTLLDALLASHEEDASGPGAPSPTPSTGPDYPTE